MNPAEYGAMPPVLHTKWINDVCKLQTSDWGGLTINSVLGWGPHTVAAANTKLKTVLDAKYQPATFTRVKTEKIWNWDMMTGYTVVVEEGSQEYCLASKTCNWNPWVSKSEAQCLAGPRYTTHRTIHPPVPYTHCTIHSLTKHKLRPALTMRAASAANAGLRMTAGTRAKRRCAALRI
jgi:hypothetical protein